MSASSSSDFAASTNELGFSSSHGANWSDYLAYRPLYRASFFQRIFDYHHQHQNAQKSSLSSSASASSSSSPSSSELPPQEAGGWSRAHDVGAGCGIVSGALAARFAAVVVSDPDEGFVALARRALVGGESGSGSGSGLPEAARFTFLREGAEASSVASASVDLVTACECMQWTEPERAVAEFARQLRPGGTLAMTCYTTPRLVSNDGRAQAIWERIWDRFFARHTGELYARAARIINTAYEHIALPAEQWRDVRRVYLNAHGTVDTFLVDRTPGRVGESRVREGEEERVWIEDDEDWRDVQGIEWLKGYFSTWLPPLPESEIQDLWDELEVCLGGEKIRIETPTVIVLATRKA
ncbi:S-adenosyl-L-methionine-dependent methyltransferase [Xylariaceae sp. FL0804]|nr:S-adenosyl-L-methionine-dependent methyltransferase [Xylariaceae sp. FL0804]